MQEKKKFNVIEDSVVKCDEIDQREEDYSELGFWRNIPDPEHFKDILNNL